MISPIHGRGAVVFFRMLAVLCVVVIAVKWFVVSPSVTVATFNIEEFPKTDEQVEGAFEAIAESDADIIAVQEITEPSRFREAARRRLSGDWRSVFPNEAPEMRPGVLFDGDRFSLAASYTHDETVVYEGARPVFEVELTGEDGAAIELFVVHLKAGSHGLPVRREQYGALSDILRVHRDDHRRTIVLGDFNSTESQDREILAATAERHALHWYSRRTPCTGYWIPEQSCESFTLDHVLADGLAGRAISRGPCETVGCEPGASCPIFHERVSDHCPLTVRFVPRD